MGVKGRRSRNLTDEPKRLNGVDDVISKAIEEGLIDNYEVNVEAIINRQSDIELIKDTEMEAAVSGSLYKVGDKWIMKVNAKHHSKRQRFTMAHELAHYILHKDERGSFVDEEIYYRKANDSAIEYNANDFASQLLMPEKLFMKAIKDDGITSVKKLSDIFNVSAQAIEIRVKKLKERKG